MRLYKDLLDERTGWLQRVHASLFHMGVPELQVTAMSAVGRERLSEAELSPGTHTAVEVGMRQVDRLTEKMHAVREQITMLSRLGLIRDQVGPPEAQHRCVATRANCSPCLPRAA